jgi:hypothetical protein
MVLLARFPDVEPQITPNEAREKDAYGMMGYCAYPGMLGWADTSPFASEGGEVIGNGVAVYCENAHVGVLAHDLLHILGGTVGGRRVVPFFPRKVRAKGHDAQEPRPHGQSGRSK